MSLLAGYDVAIEVSNPALLIQIEKNLLINGVAANPPFDLLLALAPAVPGAQAHLVARDLELDLLPAGGARLTVAFDSGSVLGGPVDVTSLVGQLVVTAVAGIFDAGNGRKQLGVDFSSASVDLSLDSASIGRLGAEAATLLPAANAALTGFLRSLSVQRFGPTIPVVAGQDGGLHPEHSAPDLPIQLESVDSVTVPGPHRERQALVLLGTVFRDHHGHGQPGQKTSSIVSAHDNFTISLSESTFDHLFFCPPVAASLLGKQPSDLTPGDLASLPRSCGQAASLAQDGIELTHLGARLAAGHVEIDAAFQTSGPCYEAKGSAHGTLGLRLARDREHLVPSLHLDHPDVDVNIDWYCALGLVAIGGIAGGIVGVVVATVLSFVADAIGNSLLAQWASGAISQEVRRDAPPPFTIGSLAPVILDDLRISPEGLSLLGNLFGYVPPPAKPGAALEGSVVTTGQQYLVSSTLEVDFCPKGTWSYEEFWQYQKASYDLVPTLLGLPLQVEWSLAFGQTTVPLDGPSGTAVIPVQAYYTLGAGFSVSRQARIGYTISGTHVELTNNPGDVNYAVVLQATATDPSGATAKAEVEVRFEGDHVQYEDAYYAARDACLRDFQRRARQWSLQHNQGPLPPLPELTAVESGTVDPNPEQVGRFVRAVLASGMPQAAELATLVRSLYGSSLAAAFASPAGLTSAGREPQAG
jgi:hypothetical protein